MDFHTVYNTQDKIHVILGKGEIVDGDVEKLRRIKSWPGLSEQLRLIDKWTPAGFALSV